jgi:hypothetical protein
VKPKPIIEMAVRTQAMSVLSAAIIDLLIARFVRSSARSVALSSPVLSTLLIKPYSWEAVFLFV